MMPGVLTTCGAGIRCQNSRDSPAAVTEQSRNNHPAASVNACVAPAWPRVS
jgi:hypothetical protein